MTKVLKCKCAHAFQDERYGEGKRVHNALATKGAKASEFRCTVCGAVHSDA